MANVTAVSAEATIAYLRFVECCTGLEIFFRGSLPIINGNVYSYIGTSPYPGTGGNLETGKCYSVFQEYTSSTIAYPGAPTMPLLSLRGTCTDKTCPSCNPIPPCPCPEGFEFIDGECTKTTTTAAEYSGQLFELESGSKSQYYCDSGLRLYPDITLMTWPVLGNGPSNAAYQLNQNNGAGPVVNPTANILSQVWGKGAAPCATGNTGGRLNIAGVGVPAYPANQELAFEFCITIEGAQPKQYMLGIAGDNYVKFYIDGNLAVFLNSPNGSVTTPFRHWHTFPITLAPGTHIIKLAGLNSTAGTAFAFAAEIYDVTLSYFQANLMAPAVSAGNCGTTPSQLEPFILFSTRDLVGQQVANPAFPGVWSCPDGGEVDFCNGTPTCVLTEKITLTCSCYLIIPCDGSPTFISNNDAFEPYVDGFITVESDDYTGCAYIVQLEDNDCLESIEAFPDPDLPCECDLNCYYVSNSNGFLYVDSNNVLQEISSLDAKPFIKICSKVYPVVENNSANYSIVALGECEDNTCPVQCFKLTNCDNPEAVIYTTSDSILPYVYGTNNIVRILNREGCWIASELEDGDICDCPIDVIVSASYATCEDCIGYIAYKLISCDNNDVIYTLLNLEAYIGQVVKLDCGCYIVQQINYLPSNPQVIKLEDVFTNCVECQRTYYKLIDCAGEAAPIITYTDLSLNVGQVVKVENCLECWTVEETTEHLNATTVVVTNPYEDCIECNMPTTCECSRVTNLNQTSKAYGYYDCDNVYHQITLAPGETSEKTCALYWVPADIYCTCIQFKQGVESVYAFIIPDTFINEKPVYYLCTTGDIDECGQVYWNGTNWVIEAPDGSVVWTLPISESNTCPLGTWDPFTRIPLTSQPCDIRYCECFIFSVEPRGTTSTFYIIGTDVLGNPIYSDGTYTITYNPKLLRWEYSGNLMTLPSDNPTECPIGFWPNQFNIQTATSIECPSTTDFTVYDHFETFGECKFGNCPQPEIKNNRTIRPGYNTPNCNPDEYDKITCRFSQVMYKVVLEKRYGITNCCPDEDEKWLLKKELIDIQALKDPNYKCPSCPCACNSGKSYSSCNCGN